MIKTFRHKGLEAFFRTGSKVGIQPHPLTGNLAGHYSVTVNGNWRIAFTFEGEDAELVDYLDYH